jgi:hypothetical protein
MGRHLDDLKTSVVRARSIRCSARSRKNGWYTSFGSSATLKTCALPNYSANYPAMSLARSSRHALSNSKHSTPSPATTGHEPEHVEYRLTAYGRSIDNLLKNLELNARGSALPVVSPASLFEEPVAPLSKP